MTLKKKKKKKDAFSFSANTGNKKVINSFVCKQKSPPFH
jgi:hypothetical protein